MPKKTSSETIYFTLSCAWIDVCGTSNCLYVKISHYNSCLVSSPMSVMGSTKILRIQQLPSYRKSNGPCECGPAILTYVFQLSEIEKDSKQPTNGPDFNI